MWFEAEQPEKLSQCGSHNQEQDLSRVGQVGLNF